MNKKSLFKKSFLILLFALIGLSLPFVRSGQTKVQPYYSGDAISYDNNLIVATANTGYLEVFRLDGKNLNRLIKVKIYNASYNNYDDYGDVKLSVENGSLYVYAVSKYTVFKSDFSDLNRLVLVNKQSNTYWNWYYRVDRYGNEIGLVGKKGVDMIDSNLQVINSFAFSPSEKYGLRSNSSQKFLFGINDGKIQVYDRDSRSISREIALNFSQPETNHKIFFDASDGNLYAIDDYYAKKFSPSGELLASFHHLDAPGYDAESSNGNPYIYFSNGFGVIKMDKEEFKLKDFVYTTNIDASQGWAMGLKLVSDQDGDKIVVFNASNITVLDDGLKKIGSVSATEEADGQAAETLFLNYDHGLGSAGSTIKLNGGGYWPNEDLKISFGGTSPVTVKTDNKGRFTADLTIPSLKPQRLDIKVDGSNSGLTYSINFEIK
jgi:hypothetical protein